MLIILLFVMASWRAVKTAQPVARINGCHGGTQSFIIQVKRIGDCGLLQ